MFKSKAKLITKLNIKFFYKINLIQKKDLLILANTLILFLRYITIIMVKANLTNKLIV